MAMPAAGSRDSSPKSAPSNCAGPSKQLVGFVMKELHKGAPGLRTDPTNKKASRKGAKPQSI